MTSTTPAPRPALHWRPRWLAILLAVSLLANLAAVWGTQQRRANHVKLLAVCLISASTLAEDVLASPPAQTGANSTNAPDPRPAKMILLVQQLSQAEDAARQVSQDYGLDPGLTFGVWGVEQTVMTLAVLPPDALQSPETRQLMDEIRQNLAASAAEGRWLAAHVPLTRSTLKGRLDRLNMADGQVFITRSGQLAEKWKGFRYDWQSVK